ncbi:CynX/NimT family MFS transporter [Allosaccharopolyspora coralli]|uniref:CynX/NimT family MFS transporter n=1 Tax=Allosaccharopolyspora coralli TaxID=2665642 RepID=UPI001E363D7B|nr:MFS transporter [Allosaccharopolyspora coralli]
MRAQLETQVPRRLIGSVVLLALVALTLRPPITAIAPVLDRIQADLGLSTTLAGLLTTLPVICLGVFAFVAPGLRQRWGDERVLLGCLVVLFVGNAARAFGGAGALFGGTVVVGAGIAVANVALPGLIKRDFPQHVPAMTALYTMCLTLGGAVAASAVVPLAVGLGSWQFSIGLIAIPVLVALAVALVVVRRVSAGPPAPVAAHGLWRNPLAWQVTVFMGMQSLMAYVVFGWLPVILQGRGFSPETAGFMLGIQAAIQAAGSLTVPLLCRRSRDQRGIAVGLTLLVAAGFTGIVLGTAPGVVWVATVVLGVAQGASFGLALTLFGLRSPDSDTTAALSGTAQGAGYLLAAVGPFAVGVTHELAGNWTVPLVFVLGCCAAMGVAGLMAGRALHVPSVHAATRA